MDLTELFEKEMAELEIYEPFEIARFLYIRTGQLFEYSKLYSFLDAFKRAELDAEQKDIFCIENFEVICFSWAQLYVDLLKYFQISAFLIESFNHKSVAIPMKYYTIVADLTANVRDFFAVKIGLPTYHYMAESLDFSQRVAEADQKIYCHMDIVDNLDLEKMRADLIQCSSNEDEFVMNAFQEVANLMERYSFGEVTGRKFVEMVMNYLVGVYFTVKNSATIFYDVSKWERIDVFHLPLPSDSSINLFYHFAPKENNGVKLVRTKKSEILSLSQRYSILNPDYLENLDL